MSTKMDKQISPGELAVGQYITVLEWNPTTSETSDGFFGTRVVTHTSQLWCGEVLQVTAVDLPYIVAKKCSDHLSLTPARLDIRCCKLMELSPEYVEAACTTRKL